MTTPVVPITERYGSLSATGLAIEPTFGAVTGATTFLPMTGNSMELDPGWFSPTLMMGARDKQVFNLYGEQHNTGTIEGPLFPSNAIQLLVAAIGTDKVTGGSSTTPYTHTISQSSGTLASLTVEKNLGDYQSIQFAGSRVSKLSIKAPTGNDPVSISADMMAQQAIVLPQPTPVSITNELPFVFAESSLSLAGGARADVTNVQIDIDNGLKETYTYSGQHGPSFISPLSLQVSGTIDVVWSSLNAATYGDFATMQDGTLGALALKFAHPGANGYSVAINCPQVALSKYTNDVKFEDVIMSSLTFEGSLPLGTGATPSTTPWTVQAVVENQVPAAYWPLAA